MVQLQGWTFVTTVGYVEVGKTLQSKELPRSAQSRLRSVLSGLQVKSVASSPAMLQQLASQGKESRYSLMWLATD